MATKRNVRCTDAARAIEHHNRITARAAAGRRVPRRAWCSLSDRLRRAALALPPSKANTVGRELLHYQQRA